MATGSSERMAKAAGKVLKRMQGNDMILNLGEVFASGSYYNCQEEGVIYLNRKFPDKPDGYRGEKTDTWQECQKKCTVIKQCKGFTWHKKSNRLSKSCSLFSTRNGEQRGSAVSGPKECPMREKECSGIALIVEKCGLALKGSSTIKEAFKSNFCKNLGFLSQPGWQKLAR